MLPLTSAQVPCFWSYVTSRLSIVLITSPPCDGNATAMLLVNRVCTQKTLWCESLLSVLRHLLWTDSPLMAEHTPQCPGCHLHELLCLSFAYKPNSLDESHSLGRLSDLWRHTSRKITQTDPISYFLSWREITVEASDYTVSIYLFKGKRRRKDDALQT